MLGGFTRPSAAAKSIISTAGAAAPQLSATLTKKTMTERDPQRSIHFRTTSEDGWVKSTEKENVSPDDTTKGQSGKSNGPKGVKRYPQI
jgi:hypothetical protein